MKGKRVVMMAALLALLTACSRAPDKGEPPATAPVPATPPSAHVPESEAPETPEAGTTSPGPAAESEPAPSPEALREIAETASETAGETADTAGEVAGTTAEPGYCASTASDVFHRCECEMAARIKGENMLEFQTREDAEKTGRRPCEICNP